MKVCIPTPLRSYTKQEKWVESHGATIVELLADLDSQFPGLRFRVVDEQGRLRQHMKVFVNQDAVRDLTTPITEADEITIMQALSGGCGPRPNP
ncbi:MAG: sulfur-carrier protein [Acidimicrobiaceae bacterium]